MSLLDVRCPHCGFETKAEGNDDFWQHDCTKHHYWTIRRVSAYWQRHHKLLTWEEYDVICDQEPTILCVTVVQKPPSQQSCDCGSPFDGHVPYGSNCRRD